VILLVIRSVWTHHLWLAADAVAFLQIRAAAQLQTHSRCHQDRASRELQITITYKCLLIELLLMSCTNSAADTNTIMAVCADPDGQAVVSQLVPLAQSSQDLQSTMVKEGLLPSLDDAAQDELVFLAHLPPVGYVACQSTCLSTYLLTCLLTCQSNAS